MSSAATTLNMHTDVTVTKHRDGSATLSSPAGAVVLSKGIVAMVEAKLGKPLPSRPGAVPLRPHNMHTDSLTTVTSSAGNLTIHGPTDNDMALTVGISGVAHAQLSGG